MPHLVSSHVSSSFHLMYHTISSRLVLSRLISPLILLFRVGTCLQQWSRRSTHVVWIPPRQGRSPLRASEREFLLHFFCAATRRHKTTLFVYVYTCFMFRFHPQSHQKAQPRACSRSQPHVVWSQAWLESRGIRHVT